MWNSQAFGEQWAVPEAGEGNLLRVALLHALRAEPGLIVTLISVDKSRFGNGLVSFPGGRASHLARKLGSDGSIGGDIGSIALTQLRSNELSTIVEEVVTDPQSLRTLLCASVLKSGKTGNSVPVVIHLRNLGVYKSNDATIPAQGPSSSRLALMCLAADAENRTRQDMLNLQRRLDTVSRLVEALLHPLLNPTNIRLHPARDLTLQAGVSGVSFRTEMLDSDTFSSLAMNCCELPAALSTLILPSSMQRLPPGVYFARWNDDGVLAAVHVQADIDGRAACELCLLRRFPLELVPFPSNQWGGNLDGFRWLRPFYHGLASLGTEALCKQIQFDVLAVALFLWPTDKGCQQKRDAIELDMSASKLPRSGRLFRSLREETGQVLSRSLPQHLVAQTITQFANALDLAVFASASRLMWRTSSTFLADALVNEIILHMSDGAAIKTLLSGNQLDKLSAV